MLIKNKGAAASFVGLIAIIALGATYSSFSPTIIEHNQYKDAAYSAGHESIQDISAEIIAYYTKVLAWFTAILAIVSIGQGFLLHKADVTARKSAEAAKSSADAATKSAGVAEQALIGLERPYIFLDTPKPVSNIRKPGIGNCIEFTLRNYGRSPAIVQWFYASSRVKESIWTELYNGRLVVGANESIIIPNRLNQPFPVNDPIGIPGGNSIIVTVELTYWDIFQYIHVAEFRFLKVGDNFMPLAGNESNRSKSKKWNKGDIWEVAWSRKFLADD